MKPWPPRICTPFGPTKRLASTRLDEGRGGLLHRVVAGLDAPRRVFDQQPRLFDGVNMSTIRNAKPWWWAIGWPNATRSWA